LTSLLVFSYWNKRWQESAFINILISPFPQLIFTWYKLGERVKIDLRKSGCDDEKWMEMAQYHYQWQALS
jgi:hypothetical protein